MPPRKRTTPSPPSLTDADVAALRARVGAGEKPRVVVRTASAAVPAGTRGNVIRVGNPSEGEFIVVRLGRDEVPFAPNELALTARSAKTLAATTPAKATRTARPAKTAGATTRRAAAAQSRRSEATARRAESKPRRATEARPVTRAGAPARPAAAAASPASAPRKATRRATKRSPHPLTVTLRFNDGAWTVEAQRGSRRVARASALRPGAVKAFADHVDEPAVRDALTETVESCRAVVEERAQKLRSELQAAEAALKEYEARRR